MSLTSILSPLHVAARREVAAGVVEFTLCDPRGGDLEAFAAGSHLTVQTPGGQRRKYSIVSPTTERAHYRIAVKREDAGRGGSRSMADDLRPGDTLLASAPENAFALVEGARRHLLIAGGIGITPLLCMARSLIADAEAEGAEPIPFKLYYLTRDPAVTAYRDEVATLGSRALLHHDHGDAALAFDLWPVLEKPVPGTHVYCCGPRPLMDAVRDMTGHWNTSAIHFESFGVGDAARFAPDQAFSVRLARSGATVPVAPGQSILEALLAQGTRVPSSCEAGSCGSCRTTYLAGEVEHRDLVLGDEEQRDQIMLCVSRARGGELVLDL